MQLPVENSENVAWVTLLVYLPSAKGNTKTFVMRKVKEKETVDRFQFHHKGRGILIPTKKIQSRHCFVASIQVNRKVTTEV